MKLKKCLLIVSILLLLISSIPFGPPENKDLGQGKRIEMGETESWTNTTRYIDEDMDIQGSLNIKNTTLVVNSSEADEIKVGSEGVLNMEDSRVVSYPKYHEKTFSKELTNDREWISIPFYKKDNSIRNVLSSIEGDYSRVISYSGWWDHSYVKSYNVDNIEDPEPPESDELQHINRTMGVWVYTTRKTRLNITGYLMKDNIFSLKEGWNMVGYPSLKERTASEVLPSTATSLQVFNASKDYNMETITDLDSYNMKPGEGYFVKVDRDSTWNLHNPGGLDDPSNLDRTGNFSITYEPGSSGRVEGCTFRDVKSENGVLSIRSDSVSVKHSDFKDVSTGIEIRSATPTIKQSGFYNYLDTGIRLNRSSSKITDNSFSTSQGWAIRAHGSSADIMKNTIEGGYGIYLNRSKSGVVDNEITKTKGASILVRKGEPLIEDNHILHSDGNALLAFSSNISIKNNLFHKNEGGLVFEEGKPIVRNNRLVGGSFGLKADGSSLTFKENHFSKTLGWAVRMESDNSTLVSNLVENCTYGISISGDKATVKDNRVESSRSLAFLLNGLNTFVFKDNIAAYNDGLGLRIEDSHGISIGNRLIGNDGGVHLTGSSKFVNATVANNGLYGIYLSDGEPYLENVILSGNENQALKSERASPLIKKSSFLGSRYHIYLIESDLTAINSFYKPQKTYQDDQSRLNNIRDLNVTMKEDTRLTNYDLVDGLPPETEILSARTPESVDVNLEGSTIDIIPASNFHGLVNLTFRVSISENWTTTYPLMLDVRPVNDPPTLRNVRVDISYEPTNVRWEVNYTDKDNYLPTYIEVVIDGNHFSMKEVNTSDHNTSDGKLYYYEKYLEPGEHEFYIRALEDNPLGKPVTAKKRSRTIDVDPPKSDWLGLEKNTLYGIGGGSIIILFLIVYFVWGGKTSLGKPDIDMEELKEELDELEEGEEGEEMDVMEGSEKTRKEAIEKGEGPALSKGKESSLPVMKKAPEAEEESGKKRGKAGINKEEKDSLPVMKKASEAEGESEEEKREEAPEKEDRSREERKEAGEEGPSKKLRKIKEEVEKSEEETKEEESETKEEEEAEIIDVVEETEVEEPEEEKEEGDTEARKHRVISDEKDTTTVKTKHRVLKGEGEKEESGEIDQGDEDQESEGSSKRQRVIKED